jgi:DNA-binding beta-propeller fold protein YncE
MEHCCMKRTLWILSILLLLPLTVSAGGTVIWQTQNSADPDKDGFGDLGGLAVARDGTIYVADGDVGIQVLASDGTWIATISNPDLFAADDVAIARDGSLWVADGFDSRVYHLDTDGNILNWFGDRGSGGGQFGELSPTEIEIAPNGNLYIFDTQEDDNGNFFGRIQVFDPQGNYLGEFPTDPEGFGVGAFMRIAIDNRGNIYGADFFGGVTVFDAEGDLLEANILQGDLSFASANAIAVSDDGLIYLAVEGAIYQVDRSGNMLDSFGQEQSNDDQPFEAGEFGEVRGMGVTPDGDLIAADTNYGWSQVVKLRFD